MATATAERHPPRVIFASCIGSALEWYDFFIYATAAGLVFGPLFFPDFGGKGTLIALATFGVGFLARPFGGLFFGYLGDRIGRKPVLLITLMLVGIGTVLIGLLPTYAQIGIWAPILLVSLRLIQGFGAGAEYTGAVILLAEYAPPGQRGFWASFAPAGVGLGMMTASGVFALVSQLPREQFLSWGWRLPFLASIVMIAFGLFVRYRIDETPVFEKIAAKPETKSKNPIIESLVKQPRNFFVVLGARLAENGFGYLFPVFGLSYAVNTLGFPKDQTLFVLMSSYVVQIACVIGFAALSDRIGRRPVYIMGALFGCAIAFPFFWLLETKTFAASVAAFWLAQMSVGMMFGTQAAYFSELFGPARRSLDSRSHASSARCSPADPRPRSRRRWCRGPAARPGRWRSTRSCSACARLSRCGWVRRRTATTSRPMKPRACRKPCKPGRNRRKALPPVPGCGWPQ